MKKYRLFAALALIAVIIGSCGRKASESPQTPAAEQSMPKINSRLVKSWMIGLTNRRPGLDAERGVVPGVGALGVRPTANAVSWFEMVDIDSNGTAEKVGFMWEATSKVMYAYTYDPVTLGQLTELVTWMVEVQSGRPTTAPSPSASGRGRTAASSKAG